MKKILFYNISGAIHSNNISEILILSEYFRNMYPCHGRLRHMNRLVLIFCRWLLKKTLVITSNLTNPKSASDGEFPSRLLCSYFWRAALFLDKLLLHTSSGVTTLTQKLLFRSSCFLKELHFENSHFLVAVIFSE